MFSRWGQLHTAKFAPTILWLSSCIFASRPRLLLLLLAKCHDCRFLLTGAIDTRVCFFLHYVVNKWLVHIASMYPLWLVVWNIAGCNVWYFFLLSPCSEWLIALPISNQSNRLQFLPDWVGNYSFWHMSCSVFLMSSRELPLDLSVREILAQLTHAALL